MSIENTLAERGSRYGDFTDHAKIAQDVQEAMRGTDGWARLSPVQKQALTVIADKVARILSGDPNYADNWHDIQGYAKLAEDLLPVAVASAPSNDNVPRICATCTHSADGNCMHPSGEWCHTSDMLQWEPRANG